MRKPIVALAVLAALLAVPGVAASSPDGGKQVMSAGSGDPDRDGVDTRNERRAGTAPRKRDSDGDGRSDGREDADRDGLSNKAEDASGNDPIARDSDDDGTVDGKEGVGVVAAFGGGTMTIRLATGGSVTAAVDDFSELTCLTESAYERGQAGRPKGLRKRGSRARRGGTSRYVPAQAPDETGDEEPADDPEWTGDEDGEDWTEDDGSGDEWSDEDDDWGEEEQDWSDEPGPSPCLSHVGRGAWVHSSSVDSDAEGSWFVAVALVR